jgi:hypothetical protein
MDANVAGSDTKTPANIQSARQHSHAHNRTKPNVRALIRVSRQALSTNTLNTFVGTNGTSYFSDPQWTNYPGRFYRLRSP